MKEICPSIVAAALGGLPAANATLLACARRQDEAFLIIGMEMSEGLYPIASYCLRNADGNWDEAASCPADSVGVLCDWVYWCREAGPGEAFVTARYKDESVRVGVENGWFTFVRWDPDWRAVDRMPDLHIVESGS